MKVSQLVSGEFGREIGVLVAVISFFEHVNVFITCGQDDFDSTVEMQNHVSGFMSKFFADFEADMETFLRTDGVKAKDLVLISAVKAANIHNIRYAKQQKQLSTLQADNAALVEDKAKLTAKIADAESKENSALQQLQEQLALLQAENAQLKQEKEALAPKAADDSADEALKFIPTSAYKMRVGIEEELANIKESLDPNDIDVVIETEQLPSGMLLNAAGKLITQRDLDKTSEEQKPIELFYSRNLPSSGNISQATWVTVFDLFRAEIICHTDHADDTKPLNFTSFEIGCFYLAKPIEVTDEAFAAQFTALKSLLTNGEVQSIVAAQVTAVLSKNDFCARLSKQFEVDSFTDGSAKIILKVV